MNVVVSRERLLVVCSECGAVVQENFDEGRMVCPECQREMLLGDLCDRVAWGIGEMQAMLSSLCAEMERAEEAQAQNSGGEGEEGFAPPFSATATGLLIKREAFS